MARTRTMRAPDGRRVRATERIERIKGHYRVMVRYLDDDGNVVDPCDLVRDKPIKSRAYVGGSARSRGASKAEKVSELTSCKLDDESETREAMEFLSAEDRARILERARSKPRDGRPGVSARDMRDIRDASGQAEREREREGLHRGRRRMPEEVLADALKDAAAINFRRVNGRELDPVAKRIAAKAMKEARR